MFIKTNPPKNQIKKSIIHRKPNGLLGLQLCELRAALHTSAGDWALASTSFQNNTTSTILAVQSWDTFNFSSSLTSKLFDSQRWLTTC